MMSFVSGYHPRWLLTFVTGGLALGFYILFGPDDESPRQKKIRKSLREGAPRGLKNIGNSCFVNAVIQALASCPTFVLWLEEKSRFSNDITVRRSLMKTMEAVNKKIDHIESSELVLTSLRCRGWRINSQEQDAHEMLQLLLSSIEEEMEMPKEETFRQILSSNGTEKPLECLGIVSRYPQSSCHHHHPKESNPFQGTITSRISFPDGKSRSPVSHMSFNNVTLTLPRNSGGRITVTLGTILQMYVSRETVNEDIVKQLTFGKLPRCLCFHIQRTTYENGFPMKRNDEVVYPSELDMGIYVYTSQIMKDRRILKSSAITREEGLKCPQSVNQMIYILCAVVVHSGEINSGHYVTYRRGLKGTKSEKSWFMISDHQVSEVESSLVFQSQAYLLFYEKKPSNSMS